MQEIKGKYNTCKVFTDNCDESTRAQLQTIMDQECMTGSRVRIMPDCHSGKGSVIGTTMTITDRVIPNIVGVDIGCGMLVIKLKDRHIDLPALDSIIKKHIKYGMNVWDEPKAYSDVDQIYANININRAYCSLGSLGAGNHFIEVDQDSEGCLYLVIHTGSRHLGLEVCNYYQDLGWERLKAKSSGGSFIELAKELIAQLKEEGRDQEISKELAKLKKNYKLKETGVCHDLAYVEGDDFNNYLHDMKLAQEHAKINRETIAKIILKKAKLTEVFRFDTIHNYIDTDAKIVRKGSISARKDEIAIVPINMRDGSLIIRGKGNEDWNYSAPHGAGRLMSRNQAKDTISMRDFKDSMEGIYSTTVCRGNIDEAPQAYKPMQEIIDNIADTAEIVDVIKPIYNFKAY
jgi:RNA-splicing ligase RtcB